MINFRKIVIIIAIFSLLWVDYCYPKGLYLNVDIEVLRKKDRRFLVSDIYTNFPENTIVFVFIRGREEKILQTERGVIINGHFGLEKDLTASGYIPGTYMVEAVIIPSFQDKLNVIEFMGKGGEKIFNEKNIEILYNDRTSEQRFRSAAGFTIGTSEELSSEIEFRKKVLIGYENELELLYDELKQNYLTFKKSFQKEDWIAWSKGWNSRIREILNSNAEYRKGKIDIVLPKADRLLRHTIMDMIFLWNEVSSELMNIKDSDRNALDVRDKEMLVFKIEKGFGKVKEELGITEQVVYEQGSRGEVQNVWK